MVILIVMSSDHHDSVIRDALRWGWCAILVGQLFKHFTYDVWKTQVFAHTNDLNEKDDTIVQLQKREMVLEGVLAANEKMHEQDAIVRLQLGKRLEQVLLDKEEAYEELDLFKVWHPPTLVIYTDDKLCLFWHHLYL